MLKTKKEGMFYFFFLIKYYSTVSTVLIRIDIEVVFFNDVKAKVPRNAQIFPWPR